MKGSLVQHSDINLYNPSHQQAKEERSQERNLHKKKKKKTFYKISTFLGVSIVALFIKEQSLSYIDYC